MEAWQLEVCSNPPPITKALLVRGRLPKLELVLAAPDPMHRKPSIRAKRYHAAAVKLPVAPGFQCTLIAGQTAEMEFQGSKETNQWISPELIWVI
jgi:hypothetical protein